MIRSFLYAGAAALLVSHAVAGSAQDDAINGRDRATGCRFEQPQRWHFTSARWTGSCSAHALADGAGVLRAYRGDGTPAESFFGQLRDGRLVSGAIETDSGYIAGRFESGSQVDSGDRNDLIHAFEDAATGAMQASEAFRRQGNQASARYYREKAQQLRAQLD